MLFATLALAVMAPYELAMLALTGYGPLLQRGGESVGTSLLLLLLKTSLITPLISALHMSAVLAVGEGRRPQLVTVVRRGLEVLPVVIAAEVMASIGIFAGFLALVIPGIVLSLRWAVSAQAAAVENAGWLEALRSSRRLTAGNYGEVFVILFVTALGAWALSVGARAIPLGSTSDAASVALGIAVDTATASFAALTLAVLYFGLRAPAEMPARAEREDRYLGDLD